MFYDVKMSCLLTFLLNVIIFSYKLCAHTADIIIIYYIKLICDCYLNITFNLSTSCTHAASIIINNNNNNTVNGRFNFLFSYNYFDKQGCIRFHLLDS